MRSKWYIYLLGVSILVLRRFTIFCRFLLCVEQRLSDTKILRIQHSLPEKSVRFRYSHLKFNKMKTELTRNMYILLSKFAKENDIKMEDKEFISALKSVFMNIVHNNTNQTFVRNTNFSKLHEKIMQQCIDFVRENPDV